ncbi:MAG: CBS domain-containing protein [Alphaproteobacteria bacterium]|nr:CBS domain-containing protein [Alphaproteobacteria bacterium]
MNTAKQLIQIKGSDVWTVTPYQTVYEAIGIMAERDVGSLLVLDGRKLIGIITERDYARNVILKGKASPDTLVVEIMDRRVVCARAEQRVDQCMDLMTKRRVRYLPVLEKGRVIGIISIGDIVKSIIEEKTFIISELENYICGEKSVH